MGGRIPVMERVPEPELMEGRQQAAAYAAADFSASDGAAINRLGQLFPAGLGPRVIDLGCGPGNISFRLAALDPQAQVRIDRTQNRVEIESSQAREALAAAIAAEGYLVSH